LGLGALRASDCGLLREGVDRPAPPAREELRLASEKPSSALWLAADRLVSDLKSANRSPATA
jgi:hypothetical protein